MLRNPFWLLTFAILMLAFFLPSYSQMQDLKQKNQEYEYQIKVLAKNNVVLREEKRLLKEDPAYFERVAREKMGLVKENEVIYKFVPAYQINVEKNPNARKP